MHVRLKAFGILDAPQSIATMTAILPANALPATLGEKYAPRQVAQPDWCTSPNQVDDHDMESLPNADGFSHFTVVDVSDRSGLWAIVEKNGSRTKPHRPLSECVAAE
jgi:hypothetical protein